MLSVIKYSFEGWGEEAKRFQHKSIDADDVDEQDLLGHFSAAVRFIDQGLYPPDAAAKPEHDGRSAESSPGSVFVHCAMGKSRSASCVIAYLLYKYPHRFGGNHFDPATASPAERRATAAAAVQNALALVREGRPLAEPNDGFMRQLELWWEMGCPADTDEAVEAHPVYQKWLYECKLKDAIELGMAPEPEWIRFEDEANTAGQGDTAAADGAEAPKAAHCEVRCKKCRRVLANPKFVIDHRGTGTAKSSSCAHVFVETLSWMRPALEEGALDGRLLCPNAKCGALVGRFAWQGLKCSCGEWICPAFSLNRSRVDEVDRSAGMGIRMPPGRNGSL